jgi:hypothetical protein
MKRANNFILILHSELSSHILFNAIMYFALAKDKKVTKMATLSEVWYVLWPFLKVGDKLLMADNIIFAILRVYGALCFFLLRVGLY